MNEDITKELDKLNLLKVRIENEIKHGGEKLSDLVNAAWRGYLASAYEWGIITLGEYKEVIKLLPYLENDPTENIFLGYPDE